MKSTPFVFLTLLLISLAFGCRKDALNTTIEADPLEPTVYVEAEVFGQVTNQNGIPVEEAVVRWGLNITQTDQNGYFKITGTVGEKLAVLHVAKENYFEAHQALSAFKESAIRTEVQLIERTLSASFSSSSGGIVNINNGGTVEFVSNGFKDQSGNPYTGEVKVFTTYLDPTLPELRALMPGNLTAINSDSLRQLLTSFGMVNVELESSTGEKLQITEKATLAVPVPGTLAGQAPSSIPLWHFDQESGTWIEEGAATLQGNEYIGEVAHFTWWNCDVPQDFIFLKGNVTAESGNVEVGIRLTNISDGSIGVLTTSEIGEFAGFVPRNEALLLELLDDCRDAIYSEEIGSFIDDAELASISLQSNSLEVVSITGIAQNCNFTSVTNGYVMIQGTPSNISTTINIGANGNFTGNFLNCGAQELSIIVVDLDEQTQSLPFIIAVQNNMNLGIVNACDVEIEDRAIIIIDGEIHTYTPCKTKIYDGGINGISYEFTFEIPSNQGYVEYRVYFEQNSSGGPWGGPLSEYTESGPYEFLYEFSTWGSNTEITKITGNESVGDISHFIATGITVYKTNTSGPGETFEEVTLDFKGIVQP